MLISVLFFVFVTSIKVEKSELMPIDNPVEEISQEALQSNEPDQKNEQRVENVRRNENAELYNNGGKSDEEDKKEERKLAKLNEDDKRKIVQDADSAKLEHRPKNEYNARTEEANNENSMTVVPNDLETTENDNATQKDVKAEEYETENEKGRLQPESNVQQVSGEAETGTESPKVEAVSNELGSKKDDEESISNQSLDSISIPKQDDSADRTEHMPGSEFFTLKTDEKREEKPSSSDSAIEGIDLEPRQNYISPGIAENSSPQLTNETNDGDATFSDSSKREGETASASASLPIECWKENLAEDSSNPASMVAAQESHVPSSTPERWLTPQAEVTDKAGLDKGDGAKIEENVQSKGITPDSRMDGIEENNSSTNTLHSSPSDLTQDNSKPSTTSKSVPYEEDKDNGKRHTTPISSASELAENVLKPIPDEAVAAVAASSSKDLQETDTAKLAASITSVDDVKKSLETADMSSTAEPPSSVSETHEDSGNDSGKRMEKEEIPEKVNEFGEENGRSNAKSETTATNTAPTSGEKTSNETDIGEKGLTDENLTSHLEASAKIAQNRVEDNINANAVTATAKQMPDIVENAEDASLKTNDSDVTELFSSDASSAPEVNKILDQPIIGEKKDEDGNEVEGEGEQVPPNGGGGGGNEKAKKMPSAGELSEENLNEASQTGWTEEAVADDIKESSKNASMASSTGEQPLSEVTETFDHAVNARKKEDMTKEEEEEEERQKNVAEEKRKQDNTKSDGTTVSDIQSSYEKPSSEQKSTDLAAEKVVEDPTTQMSLPFVGKTEDTPKGLPDSGDPVSGTPTTSTDLVEHFEPDTLLPTKEPPSSMSEKSADKAITDENGIAGVRNDGKEKRNEAEHEATIEHKHDNVKSDVAIVSDLHPVYEETSSSSSSSSSSADDADNKQLSSEQKPIDLEANSGSSQNRWAGNLVEGATTHKSLPSQESPESANLSNENSGDTVSRTPNKSIDAVEYFEPGTLQPLSVSEKNADEAVADTEETNEGEHEIAIERKQNYANLEGAVPDVSSANAKITSGKISPPAADAASSENSDAPMKELSDKQKLTYSKTADAENALGQQTKQNVDERLIVGQTEKPLEMVEPSSKNSNETNTDRQKVAAIDGDIKETLVTAMVPNHAATNEEATERKVEKTPPPPPPPQKKIEENRPISGQTENILQMVEPPHENSNEANSDNRNASATDDDIKGPLATATTPYRSETETNSKEVATNEKESESVTGKKSKERTADETPQKDNDADDTSKSDNINKSKESVAENSSKKMPVEHLETSLETAPPASAKLEDTSKKGKSEVESAPLNTNSDKDEAPTTDDDEEFLKTIVAHQLETTYPDETARSNANEENNRKKQLAEEKPMEEEEEEEEEEEKEKGKQDGVKSDDSRLPASAEINYPKELPPSAESSKGDGAKSSLLNQKRKHSEARPETAPDGVRQSTGKEGRMSSDLSASSEDAFPVSSELPSTVAEKTYEQVSAAEEKGAGIKKAKANAKVKEGDNVKWEEIVPHEENPLNTIPRVSGEDGTTDKRKLTGNLETVAAAANERNTDEKRTQRVPANISRPNVRPELTAETLYRSSDEGGPKSDIFTSLPMNDAYAKMLPQLGIFSSPMKQLSADYFNRKADSKRTNYDASTWPGIFLQANGGNGGMQSSSSAAAGNWKYISPLNQYLTAFGNYSGGGGGGGGGDGVRKSRNTPSIQEQKYPYNLKRRNNAYTNSDAEYLRRRIKEIDRNLKFYDKTMIRNL